MEKAICIAEKATHVLIKLVDIGKEAQNLEAKREEEKRAAKDEICA